jgi:hypothetical protein
LGDHFYRFVLLIAMALARNYLDRPWSLTTMLCVVRSELFDPTAGIQAKQQDRRPVFRYAVQTS